MFYFMVQLLVLSSINSLSNCEALTNIDINGIHLQQPRDDFPCPNAAEIAPCVCVIDYFGLNLDCTDISTYEELANIFTKEFPVKEFNEFRMNSSTALTTLNFTCGGVKFENFHLCPGPFPLVEVSDVFYESCSNHTYLGYVRFCQTQLSSLVFPPPPLNDKIKSFLMDYSNLTSVPAIRSNSLYDLYLSNSPISQIIPGTFDEIPQMNYLQFQNNRVKILKSDSIPINYKGAIYDLVNNGLETIEPEAFYVNEEPSLDSLYIHVHNNLLKTIDVSVFGSLMPYIKTISVYGNPLDCGCDLAWIILNPEYLEKVTNFGSVPPTCANGTLLTDLDPSTYEQLC